MHTARRSILVVVSLASFVPLAACTLASPTTITVEPGLETADGGKATKSEPLPTPAGGAAGSCEAGDFIKPDLSKLTPCGDGKGHCFDKAKTPMSDKLVACADASEVCVPDEVLEAGGNTLKSCTFVLGGPGACFTASLVPEIQEQGGGALTQDVCDPDQRCVPCVDPRSKDDAPTPFCQPIGVHEKACSGGPNGGEVGPPPAPAQPCCTTKGKSNGVCFPEAKLPEDRRDQTKQDTCGAGDRCVPAAFVSGKPVKCSAGFLGNGVCMDRCFDDMMSLAGDIGILDGEGCGDTEVCVPCNLAGKGVPGCD